MSISPARYSIVKLVLRKFSAAGRSAAARRQQQQLQQKKGPGRSSSSTRLSIACRSQPIRTLLLRQVR
eukprot:14146354-Heterocapsa_arctica.AAC.1